jgi:hypothetical protein
MYKFKIKLKKKVLNEVSIQETTVQCGSQPGCCNTFGFQKKSMGAAKY